MKFLETENTKTGYKNSKAVIIPVPYEKTTSYGKGAKNGPAAILEASRYVEHYDIEENKLVSDIGISTLPALKTIKDTQGLFKSVAEVTDKVVTDSKMPVYLGGEHTITVAIISALKKHYSDLTVLHFDAHSDLRNTYNGSKYSHACVMRRVFDMGVPFVSAGVRSQCLEEHQLIKKEAIKIFYGHEIFNDPEWARRVIDLIGKRFYLTFDVDIMDPACLWATGTPEPGGLMWPEVASFFKKLSLSGKQMVGMDMVELAPIKGDHVSDFLCAKLISKLLALFVK